ncbi:MAG: 30S ribosomal protein S16 [Candidatus Nanosyncoccaceae bacterium]|jgi:small subunit ribosomal protein S16
MLAIRLQRLGRKGEPIYRIVVQEAQKNPANGRIVAHVGSYNPHTKEVSVDVKQIQQFLDNGAQPSDRVVNILKNNKEIKFPKWVQMERPKQSKKTRNPEKLRRNQPKGAEAPAPVAEVEEVMAEPEAKTEGKTEVEADK